MCVFTPPAHLGSLHSCNAVLQKPQVGSVADLVEGPVEAGAVEQRHSMIHRMLEDGDGLLGGRRGC